MRTVLKEAEGRGPCGPSVQELRGWVGLRALQGQVVGGNLG